MSRERTGKQRSAPQAPSTRAVDQADSFARVREIVSSYETIETPAIRAAREYGIDIGLLKESLALTPRERLERAEALLEALSAARPIRRGRNNQPR